MKEGFISLFLVLIQFTGYAQLSAERPHFGVETDPIAYALKGYSLHGVYQPIGRWSYDVGIFGIQEPEGFSGNKGFDVSHRGVGVKAHYHFQGNSTRGFYVGGGTGYAFIQAKHRQSETEASGLAVSVGPHIGYRLFLFKQRESPGKGLYLTPWVSIDYQVYRKKMEFENADFKQNRWSYFPTVHIGYRF